MTKKSIHIQNKQVEYTVLGAGQPVVLIHGFAEDNNVWRHQQDELAKHYLLIVPDLPGSGESEMIEDMSIEGLASCVKQIVDQELSANNIIADRAGGLIIIGHSMGGYITLAFAEKYPEILLGFGLFHSSAFADNEEKKATRRRGITFIQTHGSYEFVKQSTPNLFTEEYRIKNNAVLEDMIARYGNFEPAALIAYYNAMIQRPDRTTVLKTFNRPVLFIIGKEDKAIPFEDSMKQCHLPPMASIQILEKAAHMGMWEEKEKSSQALLSFLQLCTTV
ncbi:MAG: alpha/beta hydrolase [Bacteroidota bacterium]